MSHLIASQKRSDANLVCAQLNFRQAREVLDRFGSRLAEQLVKIPGDDVRAIRLQVLKDSVDYYQHFVDQTANDPTLGADNPQRECESVLANSKIGDLKARMGSTQEALVHYENSRALAKTRRR